MTTGPAVPETGAVHVLGPPEISRALTRISHEILERTDPQDSLVLLGIPTRGAPLAQRLHERVLAAGGTAELGTLDVTMYRDDLRSQPTRTLMRTEVPPAGIDGATVVLVDDVLYSGRTIRAALPLISDRFERDGAEESSWWRPGLHDDLEAVGKLADQPLLLPGFDEFILGYPDRQFAMTAHQESLLVPGNNGVFRRAAVAEAVVKGFWKRDGRAGKRILLVEPFNKPLVRHHKGWERRFRDYPFLTP